MPRPKGRRPGLRPAFPKFPLREPPERPFYPPFGRFSRVGVVSAIFLPVFALTLFLPSAASTSRSLQTTTAETSFLRIDPSLLTNRGGRPFSSEVETSIPAAINDQAAVGIYLHVRGTSYQIQTEGSSLREGLALAGIFPKTSDLIRPDLDSPLLQGTHVYLQESLPVMVYADGGITSRYTLQPTVRRALGEMGVVVPGSDRVQPDIDSPVLGPMTVRITRLSQEVLMEQEAIEYQVLRRPSDNLEVNTEAVAQEGEDGILARTIRIDYEDGQEVGRTLEKEWMEKDPVPKVIHYGTQIIWRTVDTGSGPVRYRQKIRMMATSYDASGGGKDPGHPAYGITYTGMRAGRGIVAVDPRVIALYTKLYIPGYGMAVAGDTGGAIIGDRIDLGFEEGDTGLWSTRWVDVYVLN